MLTILDFEFNQALPKKNNDNVNPKCRFEIIQIGAVKIDDEFNITNEFNIMIKPNIYKKIHPYVEKITGFTDKDFKYKPYFPEAFNKFRNFIGNDTLLGTWGYSDIRALFRNLTYYGISTEPMIIEYVDIQKLATQYLKYSKGGAIGLKNAVEMFEIDIDRPFHNAQDDAYYTARVLKEILPEKLPVRVFNSSHIKVKKAPESVPAIIKNRRSKSNRIGKRDKKQK